MRSLPHPLRPLSTSEKLRFDLASASGPTRSHLNRANESAWEASEGQSLSYLRNDSANPVIAPLPPLPR